MYKLFIIFFSEIFEDIHFERNKNDRQSNISYVSNNTKINAEINVYTKMI